MISHSGGAGRALRPKTLGIPLAISMSQTTDRSAPIYASLVKGEGDNSFTPNGPAETATDRTRSTPPTSSEAG